MAGWNLNNVILVIEDDPGIRALLSAMLKRHKTVVEVGHGEEAVDAARHHRPALMLLDIQLPDMSGIEVLHRLKTDPEVADVPVIIVTARDDPSLVAVALSAGAVDYVRKPFGQEELIARIEVALRTKAEHDALRARAALDPLTLLPNRRSLDESLRREHARANRSNGPLTVMLLDVDRFKSVNDAHGHAIGDAVLRAVAERLAERCRSTDVLGRWGGDEFLLIAPDTSEDGAKALAEDLRAAVAGAPCSDLDATISIGAAVWSQEAPLKLVARADAALYDAKAAGRDTVRVARARLRRAA